MVSQNNNTALLVMDVENGIVSSVAKSKESLTPIQKAVSIAREQNI